MVYEMCVEYYGVLWESKRGFKVLMYLGDNLSVEEVYAKEAENLVWLLNSDEALSLISEISEGENTCNPETLSALLYLYRRVKGIPLSQRGRLILYLALMKILGREPRIISEYDLDEKYAVI
jgi:hypothetical protein